MLHEFLAHAHAGVGHPIARQEVLRIPAGEIAGLEGDGTAIRRELHRVAQDIDQHLAHAHGVGQHIGRGGRLHVGAEGDVPVGEEAVHDAQHGIADLREIHAHGGEPDLAALDAADVQHVVDEGEQVIGALADLLQAASDLRLRLVLHGDIGEADNRVHGRADIVGHVVQEDGLGAVGVLRRADGVLQPLVDLPVAGAVGHVQDVLLFPLDVAAEGDHMEPAHLACPAMDVFAVDLQLLAGLDAGQGIQQLRAGVLRGDQLPEGAHVCAHLVLRDAQQLLDIGAGVVHAQRAGIQHQEDVVHVGGQPGEQLVARQQLLVLLPELHAVLLHDQQQGQHGQHDGDARDDQHRHGLEPVHAGVHHGRGHDAQHHPVLEVGGLVHQIVRLAACMEHHRAGAPGSEVLLHGVQPLLAQAAGILQQGEDVVDVLHVLAGAVDHHAPVGQHGKGAGPPAKGRDLQRVHEVGIVVGDGDGLIAKAHEAARAGGDGKHHDLRLARDDGVDHHRLLVQDQIRQLVAQVQIALLPLQRDVVAVAGYEEEIGKLALLARLLHIGDDVRLALRGLQVWRPHAHAAPADGDQIVQDLIGLMENLDQVRGALLVDRLGDEVEIRDAGADHPDGQGTRKQQRDPSSFHGARPPFILSSACQPFICAGGSSHTPPAPGTAACFPAPAGCNPGWYSRSRGNPRAWPSDPPASGSRRTADAPDRYPRPRA